MSLVSASAPLALVGMLLSQATLQEPSGIEQYRNLYTRLAARVAGAESFPLAVTVMLRFWDPSAPNTDPITREIHFRWAVTGDRWQFLRILDSGETQVVGEGDRQSWRLNWKGGQERSGKFSAERSIIEEILLPPPPQLIRVLSLKKKEGAEPTFMLRGMWNSCEGTGLGRTFTLNFSRRGVESLSGTINLDWNPSLTGTYSVVWRWKEISETHQDRRQK